MSEDLTPDAATLPNSLNLRRRFANNRHSQTRQPSSMMVFKNPENLFGNLVHRTVAIDRDHPARALVIIRHGSSLLLVSLQTGLNHFQPVVIAGHQLGPV